MNSYNSPSTKYLYHGTQIIWYILGLLNAILAFRFILKLLAANQAAGFSKFIYALSKPFVYPFLNVFKAPTLEGSTFEWATLLAMLVYSLIAWGIVRIFFMSKTISTPEAAVKLNEENK